jgi:hypothetical protein
LYEVSPAQVEARCGWLRYGTKRLRPDDGDYTVGVRMSRGGRVLLCRGRDAGALVSW